MSIFGRRSGALSGAVVVVAALAGCGGASSPNRSTSLDGLSGAEIITRAIDATASVKTLRLRYTADAGRAHIHTDLRRTTDGTCFGQMEFHTRTVTVILADSYTYVRASAAYWRQFSVPQFGRRMARTPSSWARLDTEDFYDRYCDIRQLAADNLFVPQVLEDMRAGAEHDGPDGRRVLDVTNSEGNPTIVINANAAHYVLEMRFNTTQTVSRTVLSAFDEPAEVRIPPEGEYIPFDQLVVTL